MQKFTPVTVFHPSVPKISPETDQSFLTQNLLAIPGIEHVQRWPVLTFWLPVIVCFTIANTTIDRYETAIRIAFDRMPIVYGRLVATMRTPPPGAAAMAHYLADFVLVPARHALFIVGLAALVIPTIRPVVQYFKTQDCGRLAAKALLSYAMLLVLIFNLRLGAMGRAYAAISFAPFAQHVSLYYRRILLPVLGDLTGLQGPVVYPILHCGLTFLLLFAAWAWLDKKKSGLNIFQGTAVFTSGVFICALQAPGNSEQAVFLLLLVAVLTPLGSHSRAALIAIMFLAHETAAVVMGLPIILLLFPKRDRTLSLMVMGVYLITALANFGFDPRAAIVAQTVMGEGVERTSSLQYLLAQPARAAWGVLFAYKVLWVVPIVALALAVRCGQARFAIVIATTVLLPIATLPAGIDTSRLVAFGTFGILLALVYVYHMLPRWQFNLTLLANALTPSYYVVLDNFFNLKCGLYLLMLHGMRALRHMG